MGLAQSTGRNNDHLVDLLLDSEGIKSPQVELAMRDQAYKDSAWRSEEADPGYFHLSAPCIYANALEHLDLKPGLSFLNIGSGTGYLSTMVGFIIGESGINHGIELYPNVVRYAEQKVEETLLFPECSAFSWRAPEFYQGNGFQLVTKLRYDRIYCGAQVPDEERKDFVTSLLRIGGLCVMPYEHDLQRIKRVSEDEFQVYNISAVSFARFVLPDPERLLSIGQVEIGCPQPKSLLVTCREKIREVLRLITASEFPLEMRSECEKKRLERAEFRQQVLERRQRQRSESQRVVTGGRTRGERGRERSASPPERAGEERTGGNRDRIRGLVTRGGDLLAALHRRVQRHQDARRAQLRAVARSSSGSRVANPVRMPPAAADDDDDTEEDPDLRVRIIVRHRDPREDEEPTRQAPRTSGGDKGRMFHYVTVERLDGEEGGTTEASSSSAPTAAGEVVAEEGRDFSVSRRQIYAIMNRVLEVPARRTRGEHSNESSGVVGSAQRGPDMQSGGTDEQIDWPESTSSGPEATSSTTSSAQSHHKRARDEDSSTAEESERELKRRNMPIPPSDCASEEGVGRTGLYGSDGADKSSPSKPLDPQEAEFNESAMEQMDGIGHACDEPIDNEDTVSAANQSGGTESSVDTGHSYREETSRDTTTETDDDETHQASEDEEDEAEEQSGEESEDEEDTDEEEEEDEKIKETSAQALSLRCFHESFLRRIDELSISERMKSFLKYRD